MSYSQFVPHHDPFPHALFDEVSRHVADNEIVVEVGACMGHGTCYLAEQFARQNKRPRFYAIDSWDQVLEPVYGAMRTEPLPWGESIEAFWKRGGSLYETFLYHLEQCPDGDRLFDHAQFPAICCFGEWADDSVSAVILHQSRDEREIDVQVAGWWTKLRSGGMVGIWDGAKTRTMIKA